MRLLRLASFLVSLLGAPLLFADPGAAGSDDLKSEVLLDSLDNPCGIALRPPSYTELFLAESGAGRILRVRLSEHTKPTSAIEGFPRHEFGDGPRYRIGPLAVAFIDRTTLVVGEGGQSQGADAVRVYQLPEDGKSLTFDQSKHTLRAPAAADSAAKEGDFFAISATPATLFIAGAKDRANGWILKADVANLATNRLDRFIATKRETRTSAPTALAMSKRGELVVAQAGELGTRKDSVLSFFSAASGKRLLKLDTGLHDITGLAYAQSGLLYAIDFAWSAPSAGGLYRLEMELRGGRQAVKAVKLLALDRPAGLAILSDRVLYVTTFGSGANSQADGGPKTGKLQKIEKTDGEF